MKKKKWKKIKKEIIELKENNLNKKEDFTDIQQKYDLENNFEENIDLKNEEKKDLIKKLKKFYENNLKIIQKSKLDLK